ncbi:mitochondrial carrier domain-containing protein [Thamnocephalis sphaerospora]|uniref:Mitochondrial carrier domain-containing protein n=1 Tax=Thamnocephalis sphaerospora TaxID=78915 RepID=A0A4P9XGT0_9FUNG|nr:mitochondrial carrier domain-containing protein [Thamnocephalis sphaerospora]|eukprot:RKP04808.1 mitochondrial carrier domain-containing protein [Thamnocephalis sphaerospora]
MNRPEERAVALTGWQSAVCGSGAGVVSRFVVAPLDVVKIRFQLQSTRRHTVSLQHEPKSTIKYHGVLQSLRTIAREEGFYALWKGNLAAEYLYLAYGALQFFAHREGHRFFQELRTQTGWGMPQGVQSFTVGAFTGVVATVGTYPLDLLRTRYASQGVHRIYGSILSTLREIVATEGVRGLYRGLVPSIVQIVPYMGLMFGSYESLRRVWSQLDFSRRLDSLGDALCGGTAGIISKTGVFPLDVVRKRLQIQGPSRRKYAVSDVPRYTGRLIATTRQMVRHEGVASLYRGYVPGMLKAAPAAAVTFFVYGRLREWMLHLNGPEPSD